ncbi:MAG TPA: helix-turn-helix transcriptional regulator [Planctomycetota bacterium]|nr:helix-turn-helix transcriptional regulator [Planctomycetota bacterium]
MARLRHQRTKAPTDQPSRDNSIGTFVRARRKAAGLTQLQLAELAGVGLRFVSELERGKPSMRLDVVNRVLVAFGKQLGVADGPRRDGS